jgi:hypothetical protein
MMIFYCEKYKNSNKVVNIIYFVADFKNINYFIN